MEMGLLITGVGAQEPKQIDLKRHVNSVSAHSNVLEQAITAAGEDGVPKTITVAVALRLLATMLLARQV